MQTCIIVCFSFSRSPSHSRVMPVFIRVCVCKTGGARAKGQKDRRTEGQKDRRTAGQKDGRAYIHIYILYIYIYIYVYTIYVYIYIYI